MYELSSHFANISVLAISNIEMFYYAKAGDTHRVHVSCMIKGKVYEWLAYYNQNEVGLQAVLRRAVKAIMRKEKCLSKNTKS